MGATTASLNGGRCMKADTGCRGRNDACILDRSIPKRAGLVECAGHGGGIFLRGVHAVFVGIAEEIIGHFLIGAAQACGHFLVIGVGDLEEFAARVGAFGIIGRTLAFFLGLGAVHEAVVAFPIEREEAGGRTLGGREVLGRHRVSILRVEISRDARETT